MTRILGFSGRKGSGKSTCSNFIHGYQLRAFNVVQEFSITESGDLVVQDGRRFVKLDLRRVDDEFFSWAIHNMWPYVKNYSFASPLKTIASELFGLTKEQCYGTQKQKNEKIKHLLWENMPGVVTENWLLNQHEEDFPTLGLTYHRPGPMTAREFLQYFGTDVCRKIFNNIWTERLIKDVQNESSLLAVVDDARFENEIEHIHKNEGKVIRLTRNPNPEDHHDSEKALDSFEGFDAVIDNQNMNIHETNIKIIELLKEWDWLGDEIKAEQTKPEIVGGIHKIKG